MIDRPARLNLVRVALIEPDTRTRSGILSILGADSGLECMAAFARGQEALSALPALQPEVILTDLQLPDIDGIAFIQKLAAAIPGVQIVVLTAIKDTGSIFNALAAGAGGYLLKPFQSADLIAAIRDVSEGGAPMTGFVARKVIQAFRKNSRLPRNACDLARREAQVLELLSRGLTYQEVADQLSLSYATVRTYIERICEKLRVRTMPEAIARYLASSRSPIMFPFAA